MQAMILAAGQGSRLRPLTDHTPKPLVRVGGVPLIDYHLIRLAALGIHDVFINVSHLGDQIEAHCGDGSHFGLRLCYSRESGGPIGAVPGIRLAMTRGLSGQFLLISADCWFAMSPDDPFLQAPFSRRLLLVPNPPYHPEGDFGLTDEGVLTLQGAKHTYGCMGLYDTQDFERSPEASNLTSVLLPFMKEGDAFGVLYRDAHFNVGTQKELDAVESHLT